MAASTTLLADSQSGLKSGALPWSLLLVGSVASLAANVAVAEPTLIGRVIAAWPSFAPTASYELLTRQVRRGAPREDRHDEENRSGEKMRQQRLAVAVHQASPGRLAVVQPSLPQNAPVRGDALQRQAWQWALARQTEDGVPPSGRAIAGRLRSARTVEQARQERGSG